MTKDETSLRRSARSNWAERRAEVATLGAHVKLDKVRRSLVPLLPAESTAHRRLADQVQSDAVAVDLALATLSHTGDADETCDSRRSQQQPSGVLSPERLSVLRRLTKFSLTERDFPEHERGIKEQGGGSFVSICRCRLQPRRLYAVKSMTKALAKQCWPPMDATLERKLLTRATAEAVEAGRESLLPLCFGAYQTSGSVNIVMEYFREGDVAMFMDTVATASSMLAATTLSDGAEVLRLRHPHGGLLSEDLVRVWATDMVASIAWLHKQGFMHRDIKPANFVISSTGHVKLIDFGTAAPFASFRASSVDAAARRRTDKGALPAKVRRVLNSHNDEAGTADYLSPEMVLKVVARARKRNWLSDQRLGCNTTDTTSLWMEGGGAEDDDEDDDDDASSASSAEPSHSSRSRCPPSPNPRRVSDPDGAGDYGPEVDWWALGVSVYEMIFGHVPFEGQRAAYGWGAAAQQEQILNAEERLHFDEGVVCSPELLDLLKRLICSPDKRLGRVSTRELHEHPFFRGADWSHPLSQPSPYVSPIEPEQQGIDDPSPSPLHSPRPQPSKAARGRVASGHAVAMGAAMSPPSLSTLQSSLHLSAMVRGLTAADLPDFPSFLEGPDNASAYPEARSAQDYSATWGPDMPPVKSLPELSVWECPDSPEDKTISADVQYGQNANRGSRRDQASEIDLGWIGFTYLPGKHAFDLETLQSAKPSRAADQRRPALKASRKPVRFAAAATASPRSDVSNSPEPVANNARHGELPVASTPFPASRTASLSPSFRSRSYPTPPPALMTPAPASAARAAHDDVPSSVLRTLQKRAVQSQLRAVSYSPHAASDALHQAAASSSPLAAHQLGAGKLPTHKQLCSLKTPQRKTSMPDIGSPDFRIEAQAQHCAALQAQTPGSAMRDPLAAGLGTVARRAAAVAASGIEGVARLLSETPSSAHTSTAQRHRAERQAWENMLEAVQKSVRKTLAVGTKAHAADARTSMAAKQGGDETVTAAAEDKRQLHDAKSRTRPPMAPKARSDPANVPHCNLGGEAKRDQAHGNAADSRPLPVDKGLAARRRQGWARAASAPVLQIDVDTTGPTSGSPLSTLLGFAPRSAPPVEQPSGRAEILGAAAARVERGVNTSAGLLAVPLRMEETQAPGHDGQAQDGSRPLEGRKLERKRSARQLLIKAQEKTTPTKPARAQSPCLTTTFDEKELAPPTQLLDVWNKRSNDATAALAPTIADPTTSDYGSSAALDSVLQHATEVGGATESSVSSSATSRAPIAEANVNVRDRMAGVTFAAQPRIAAIRAEVEHQQGYASSCKMGRSAPKPALTTKAGAKKRDLQEDRAYEAAALLRKRSSAELLADFRLGFIPDDCVSPGFPIGNLHKLMMRRHTMPARGATVVKAADEKSGGSLRGTACSLSLPIATDAFCDAKPLTTIPTCSPPSRKALLRVFSDPQPISAAASRAPAKELIHVLRRTDAQAARAAAKQSHVSQEKNGATSSSSSSTLVDCDEDVRATTKPAGWMGSTSAKPRGSTQTLVTQVRRVKAQRDEPKVETALEDASTLGTKTTRTTSRPAKTRLASAVEAPRVARAPTERSERRTSQPPLQSSVASRTEEWVRRTSQPPVVPRAAERVAFCRETYVCPPRPPFRTTIRHSSASYADVTESSTLAPPTLASSPPSSPAEAASQDLAILLGLTKRHREMNRCFDRMEQSLARIRASLEAEY